MPPKKQQEPLNEPTLYRVIAVTAIVTVISYTVGKIIAPTVQQVQMEGGSRATREPQTMNQIAIGYKAMPTEFQVSSMYSMISSKEASPLEELFSYSASNQLNIYYNAE